ncbi:MAG: anhydro-N-acetylmuramic acid kinase [Planctomycetota bacterium]
MNAENPRVRHVVGCMTGTSLDGLDAALVRITGTGLEMTAEFVGMISAPLPDPLRTTLLSMANGEPHPPIEFMRAARYLGVVHAEAVAQLLATHAKDLKPDFIVAHGQTIWHAPADRLSWQLFDPWPIVRALQLPVCYDLRQADLVAGGEGAPITPIVDPMLYPGEHTLIVNLGGIVNVTYWDDGEEFSKSAPMACDVCPGNLLLDGLARRLFDQPFDRDGQLSANGKWIEGLWRKFEQVLPIHGPGDGSLGQQHCSHATIDRIIAESGGAEREDLLHNAIEFIAQAIGEVCESLVPERVVLCGGGVNNPVLVAAIRSSIQNFEEAEVLVSDDLGIPCEAREAMGFAVLGALSQDGVPITLPQVTGAEKPGVAGVWAYPEGPAGEAG